MVAKRLLKVIAVAVPLAGVGLWLGGALDEVEWHGDFVNGVLITAICAGHAVVGYAFPRGRTYLLITLLWLVPTIGADISWSVTGWDPWNTPREDPYCDPCVPPSFGFFYIVIALPLVAAGHGLRRLDRRHARRIAAARADPGWDRPAAQ